MSRVFFKSELEGVATYWRIFRRDGVTLGFTSHDRDLWFGGIRHQAAPGMLPSAIRKTKGLTDDSAEITGALSHEAITTDDLLVGRFDHARIEVGVVDWENYDQQPLYFGEIGAVSATEGQFTADLLSPKAQLDRDVVPRTSPTCRAEFCGEGCNLASSKFTFTVLVSGSNTHSNSIAIAAQSIDRFVGGSLCWLDGPHAGLSSAILGVDNDQLILLEPIPVIPSNSIRISIVEGCDHRLETCSARFDNAINFQAEPFLPGNDRLLRGPLAE